MDNNPLADLKNIHLPQNVSIFPLTVGWYLVISLILLAIIFLLYWQFILKKRLRQKKHIYHLLSELEATASANETILSDVSILLKRVAIMRFPELHPQSLFGEKWLAFLDKTGKTSAFGRGPGRVLLNIYKNEQLKNHAEFFVIIKQWLRNVL